MEKENPEIWFPAKIYGWGWGIPVKWQGWVVLVAYLASVTTLTKYHRPTLDFVGWLMYFLPLTAILVAICWFKGEKPSWHWGND